MLNKSFWVFIFILTFLVKKEKEKQTLKFAYFGSGEFAPERSISHYCRVVPKNYFKQNCTYVLNNMMQVLQVNKNSNIKYNIMQVELN